MRSTQEEIDIEVDLIRGEGHYGDLHIVPTVDKLCFLYCGKGKCNCQATVSRKYCILIDERVIGAQKEFLAELESLENKINKT